MPNTYQNFDGIWLFLDFLCYFSQKQRIWWILKCHIIFDCILFYYFEKRQLYIFSLLFFVYLAGLKDPASQPGSWRASNQNLNRALWLAFGYSDCTLDSGLKLAMEKQSTRYLEMLSVISTYQWHCSMEIDNKLWILFFSSMKVSSGSYFPWTMWEANSIIHNQDPN